MRWSSSSERPGCCPRRAPSPPEAGGVGTGPGGPGGLGAAPPPTPLRHSARSSAAAAGRAIAAGLGSPCRSKPLLFASKPLLFPSKPLLCHLPARPQAQHRGVFGLSLSLPVGSSVSVFKPGTFIRSFISHSLLCSYFVLVLIFILYIIIRSRSDPYRVWTLFMWRYDEESVMLFLSSSSSSPSHSCACLSLSVQGF